MIEAIIAAEKRYTGEQVDVKPDKVLKPIGYVSKEWTECLNTTDLPHWTFWEVIGEFKSWRGTGRYERVNEIQSFWFMVDFKG